MATRQKLEKPESKATGLKLEPVNKLAENDKHSRKDAMLSNTISSIPSRDSKSSSKRESDVTSGIKGVQMESFGQQALYNPPTSTYGYYYPGYNGPFPQMDEHGYFQADGSHMAMQSDNGQMVYYMPGYNPYSPGAVVGVDGQTANQQQFYPPSEYIQHPVSYGSEAVPCYQWDATYLSETPNGNGSFGTDNHNRGGATLPKFNGLNSMKTNGNISSKFPKPSGTQDVKPLIKVPPYSTDYSTGVLSGFNNGVGKLRPFSGQSHYALSQYGSLGYRNDASTWNVNDRNRSRYRTQRNGSFESSIELACGPRGANKSVPTDPAVKKENPLSLFSKDQYNLQDFETVYESAKFYVIKSYSEDDIHKSIKYNVWSSTPNGNKKLDAAFRDSEEKSRESGTKCPVFLFFSVNGSGQFVGLAEMTGLVDFNKDMDFWQVDKWSGFFPLKWHIVKDIPNTQLRHIVLENNDNRPVTFSRDTQEIGLKQGLEMLKIFKEYTAKASLLDDFTFYEDREKALHAKKNKPATLKMEEYESGDFVNEREVGGKKYEDDGGMTKRQSDASTLINLTKNLSLNGPAPAV